MNLIITILPVVTKDLPISPRFAKTKPLYGIKTGSPMVVTLGQQLYNVGEKPTVIILYTYINRHAGTPNETKECST